MNALLPVKRFWDDNDEGGCDNDGPNKEVTEKALKKLKRKGEKKRREEELDQVVVESPDKLAGKEEVCANLRSSSIIVSQVGQRTSYVL